MGKSTRRILRPTKYRIGITTMAIHANSGSMLSMKPKARTPIDDWTKMSGAKVEYICTLRMSELARLIN